MDFIRPISSERDVDPLVRVERARDERERRDREAGEREAAERRERRPGPSTAPAAAPAGQAAADPFEGDDGRLHIDTTA